MKQVIGIYCGNLTDYYWDENTILENGGGGSETWAVEIAREFQSRGFHVIVFGNPDCWKFASSGVEYVPFSMFHHRCEYQHFDYFISSRQISEIGHFLKCDNVYIMSHDICLHYADEAKDLKLDRVKKIAYLSEWHRDILEKWYKDGIPNGQMFKTINGVDPSIYSKSSEFTKENMMVWSSRSERGLRYFINWVYPAIKEKVPDFKLKVCLYLNDFSDECDEGIELFGKLGKNDLAELQMRSKLWVYPNLGFLDTNGMPFQETFCITAVENGLAENAIVCGDAGGLKTTLEGYSGLIGKDIYENGYINGHEKMVQYAEKLADESIKILTDDDYRLKKAAEAKSICSKYTWANSVETWLNEWNIKY